MARLDDQVALLTGAGSGIGRAVGDAFQAEGARLVAIERDAAAVAELTRAWPEAEIVEGDVRLPEAHTAAVDATLARFGRLDVLVANAGIWDYCVGLERLAATGELPAAFREVFEVNVLGVALAAAAAREALVESRGTIIATSSSSGRRAGGGGPLYVASKHAVDGLVKQLAFELAPEVRVNAVAPGATQTGLAGPAALAQSDRRLAEEDGLGEAIGRALPLGFVAEPADHASLFVLLASRHEARFVTGSIFASDGGVDLGRRRTPGSPAAKVA